MLKSAFKERTFAACKSSVNTNLPRYIYLLHPSTISKTRWQSTLGHLTNATMLEQRFQLQPTLATHTASASAAAAFKAPAVVFGYYRQSSNSIDRADQSHLSSSCIWRDVPDPTAHCISLQLGGVGGLCGRPCAPKRRAWEQYERRLKG